MTTKNVVIVRNAAGTTQFWSGKRWVNEFPDSKAFTAKGAFNEAKAQALNTVGQLFLVENYGADEDTEIIIPYDGP